MSATNLFGAAVSGGMVEQAVAASLGEWMDTYLGEAERLEGYQPGALQRPLGIITRSEFDKWPEEQVPLIMVMTPGLASAPVLLMDGHSYRAEWSVAIAAIVSAGDPDGNGQEATRKMALAYALAIRMALGQHKMLKSTLWPNGFASGSVWTDEGYQEIPSTQERALGASRVVYTIGVDNVLTEFAGPRSPLVDPAVDPGNWPSATVPPAAQTEPIGIEEAVR